MSIVVFEGNVLLAAECDRSKYVVVVIVDVVDIVFAIDDIVDVVDVVLAIVVFEVNV